MRQVALQGQEVVGSGAIPQEVGVEKRHLSVWQQPPHVETSYARGNGDVAVLAVILAGPCAVRVPAHTTLRAPAACIDAPRTVSVSPSVSIAFAVVLFIAVVEFIVVKVGIVQKEVAALHQPPQQQVKVAFPARIRRGRHRR